MFRVSGIFGSTEAVKEAVKAGLGFSILSKVAVIDDIRSRNLVEIRTPDIKMKRKFYIATHRKRTIPHSYSVFIDYLKRSKRLKPGF
jgi:DNA-binding transcriptional LysR family regulator